MDFMDKKSAISDFSDSELIDKYNEGDIYSLYILIHKRYKKRLLGVLGKIVTFGYSDFDLDEKLSDFFYFLVTPLKNGKNRLSSYDKTQAFGAYISTMLRNWTIDALDIESKEQSMTTSLTGYDDRLGEGEEDIDDGSVETSSELIVSESISDDELNAALILALEHLRDMSSQNRYIVLTYLLCERLKVKGEALYLAKKLAEQLGISEGAVKMSNKRALERFREEAKKYLKKGVTFS